MRARERYSVAMSGSNLELQALPSGEEDVVVAGAGEAAHEVLGVSMNASDEEIRTAYRQRVKETHPDNPDGDKCVFRRVQEVNEALL